LAKPILENLEHSAEKENEMSIKERITGKPLPSELEENADTEQTGKFRPGRFAHRRRVQKHNEAARKQGSEKYVSANIVKFLREARNMTLKEIGTITGCGESFVCRVGKGQRAFTLKHLALIEEHLHIPLPLLLLDSVNQDALTDEMRSLYHSFRSRVNRVSEPNWVQSD